MARIFKKTGLFGLGRGEHINYCDRCHKEISENMEIFWSDDLERKMYCIACAPHVGIELVPHYWSSSDEVIFNYEERNFFTDKRDGQRKIIIPCCYCDGLMVGVTDGKRLKRTYYKIGSKTAHSSSFPCTRIPDNVHFTSGHRTNSLTCTHDFLTIASTLDVSDEARRRSVDSERTYPDILEKMYGPLNHEAIHQGELYIWCRKCGLYYELPPTKVQTLKRTGVNIEWYMSRQG
jgi:hypothetical protein